jgi:hypothetical protein
MLIFTCDILKKDTLFHLFTLASKVLESGTYKVRNDIETKRNEINKNETKRNETKSTK